MVGTLASCDSQFRNPGSQVSAHFGVGLDGTVHQYVDWKDGAWANGILETGNRWEAVFGSENPNRRTISIETEDLGDPVNQPVTNAQYDAVLALCRQAMEEWPSITHVASHAAISPQSRSCPGARWRAARLDMLARDLGLELLA